MVVRKVTTSLPPKYYRYVHEKRLKFSDLLLRAIEREMCKEPQYVKQKIKTHKKAIEQLEKQHTTSLVNNEKNRKRLKQAHQGDRVI